jgi:hypothetical protein
MLANQEASSTNSYTTVTQKRNLECLKSEVGLQHSIVPLNASTAKFLLEEYQIRPDVFLEPHIQLLLELKRLNGDSYPMKRVYHQWERLLICLKTCPGTFVSHFETIDGFMIIKNLGKHFVFDFPHRKYSTLI